VLARSPLRAVFCFFVKCVNKSVKDMSVRLDSELKDTNRKQIIVRRPRERGPDKQTDRQTDRTLSKNPNFSLTGNSDAGLKTRRLAL
jgi:hypothetical protein